MQFPFEHLVLHPEKWISQFNFENTFLRSASKDRRQASSCSLFTVSLASRSSWVETGRRGGGPLTTFNKKRRHTTTKHLHRDSECGSRKKPKQKKTWHVKCGCIQTPGMKEQHQKGIHCDRAVIYPTPSLFYASSSQFHRPFLLHSLSLPLPVCTEGRGQAAVPFLPAVATKCFVKPRPK